jgi:hypothetical protein
MSEEAQRIGLECRRTRDVPERDLRQRFFWAGDVIIEVVGPIEPGDDGPSAIWGLALVSDDLDESKAVLGDRLGDPRAAIQKGRRIAAIRTPELGISITLALMTPHVPA